MDRGCLGSVESRFFVHGCPNKPIFIVRSIITAKRCLPRQQQGQQHGQPTSVPNDTRPAPPSKAISITVTLRAGPTEVCDCYSLSLRKHFVLLRALTSL